MFVPSALGRVVQARSERDARTIGLEESMFVLYRDMAASLRASQPAGDITLLADFNTSLSVGYYGQFKTIGTPYWENAAGLKAAAEILSAPAAEAKELIRERKITHIALVSADNFAAVYFMVSHPGGSDEEYKASLGYQLVTERKPPLWLQAVPFTWPEDLGPHSGDVLLYKVAFDQTAADALYHTALAEVARGDLDGAERDLDEVIRQTPKAHLPWLSKSGVLFAKRDWAGSADAAIKGIALAPAAQRTALYGWAAANLVRLEQHAQAIRVYHAGLADSFSADMACSLAFELSTPNDATVRNGAEAVALARRAVATKPDVPMYFNCLGAALAESGQYPEAVKTEERAVASAHALGDATTERVSAALLESFKAGKPWRE
jgi:tetratricopeptide (TPR) repeat protein